MSEATEKQISFAKSLGIKEPETKSKETLKVLIDEKLKEQSTSSKKTRQDASMGQIGATEGISDVKHHFQSEYEFGPAGNRHRIKYFTVEELKQKMKELEDAGYFIEHLKF